MNRNATAERKRNLTKEKIVVEGAKVFNKRGYYGTTLDDIAGELEVTKAALYYHIRSKEEILYECHKAGLDVATLAVEKAVQDSAAPDDQLWIAISYFIEYRHRSFARCSGPHRRRIPDRQTPEGDILPPRRMGRRNPEDHPARRFPGNIRRLRPEAYWLRDSRSHQLGEQVVRPSRLLFGTGDRGGVRVVLDTRDHEIAGIAPQETGRRALGKNGIR